MKKIISVALLLGMTAGVVSGCSYKSFDDSVRSQLESVSEVTSPPYGR